MTSRLILIIALFLISGMSQADVQKVDDAISDVIYETNVYNVDYEVMLDGEVEIYFGSSVIENEFVEVTTMLKQHPHVKKVFASKGFGNFCINSH